MYNQKILEVIGIFKQILDGYRHFGKQVQQANLPFIMPASHIDDVVSLAHLIPGNVYNTAINDEVQKAAATGLVCAQPHTVNTVLELNQHKQQFKKRMVTLRQELGKVENIGQKIAPDVKEMLKSYRLLPDIVPCMGTRANLAICYTPIRVLPENLRQFNWTWARKHTKIQTLDRAQAQLYAQSFPVTYIANELLKAINSLYEDDKFALVIEKKPQLRANIQYQQDDEIIKKAISVSGLCVVQAEQLPQYRWRPLDTSTPKIMVNRPRTIEPDELVRGSFLHRFLK